MWSILDPNDWLYINFPDAIGWTDLLTELILATYMDLVKATMFLGTLLRFIEAKGEDPQEGSSIPPSGPEYFFSIKVRIFRQTQVVTVEFNCLSPTLSQPKW